MAKGKPAAAAKPATGKSSIKYFFQRRSPKASGGATAAPLRSSPKRNDGASPRARSDKAAPVRTNTTTQPASRRSSPPSTPALSQKQRSTSLQEGNQKATKIRLASLSPANRTTTSKQVLNKPSPPKKGGKSPASPSPPRPKKKKSIISKKVRNLGSKSAVAGSPARESPEPETDRGNDEIVRLLMEAYLPIPIVKVDVRDDVVVPDRRKKTSKGRAQAVSSASFARIMYKYEDDDEDKLSASADEIKAAKKLFREKTGIPWVEKYGDRTGEEGIAAAAKDQLAAFEKGLPDGKGGFRFEKTNNRGWGGWEQAKVHCAIHFGTDSRKDEEEEEEEEEDQGQKKKSRGKCPELWRMHKGDAIRHLYSCLPESELPFACKYESKGCTRRFTTQQNAKSHATPRVRANIHSCQFIPKKVSAKWKKEREAEKEKKEKKEGKGKEGKKLPKAKAAQWKQTDTSKKKKGSPGKKSTNNRSKKTVSTANTKSKKTK